MAFSFSVLSSIVAAILVALACSLWREQVRHFFAALSSLLRLHFRLSSAGLIRFVRDREDYKSSKSDGIAKYIRTAKRSVHIVGINLITGVDSDDLLQAIREIVSRNPTVNVAISLLDPRNPMAMAAISQNLGKAEDELASSIRSSLRNLVALRNTLPVGPAKHFIIKAHSILPFASAIIIDGHELTGEIQLETKPYKQPINKSIGFTLRGSARHSIYQTLFISYQALIEDARFITADADLT
jgi:hypothetical protein